MFDSTAFTDKAKKEIELLNKTLSPEELSFFVYSGYYINSQKTVMEKI
ncbi:hypothetical protein M1146_06940 [Patescibacteria group bacterium]|nr:hypothetical protein [Patescibacteria group bacterium]